MIQFFLFTGGREQEVEFATWPDIDFDGKTFLVRQKIDLEFHAEEQD